MSDFTLHLGDCIQGMAGLLAANSQGRKSLGLKFRAMFKKMRGTGDQFKILDSVVGGLSVAVMNDVTSRDLPVCRFPDQRSSQFPDIWLSDLYPDASLASLIGGDVFRSNRKVFERRPSRLEFGSRRHMHPFGVLIPGPVSIRKRIGGPYSFSQGIAKHPRLRNASESSGSVPTSTAFPGAKAGGFGAVVPHGKRDAADFTFLIEHAQSIATLHNGARSTGIACTRDGQ